MPDKLNLDDDSIERLVKKLGERSLNIDGKSIEDFGKAMANLNKDLKKNTVTYGGLAAQMMGVNKRYKDLTSTIESLQEQIEELADLEGEEAAEKQRGSRVFTTEELGGIKETCAILLVEIDGHPSVLASLGGAARRVNRSRVFERSVSKNLA